MIGVPLPAHARDVISRDQFPVARRSDGSCWRTLGTRDVGRMIKLKVALREAEGAEDDDDGDGNDIALRKRWLAIAANNRAPGVGRSKDSPPPEKGVLYTAASEMCH